MECKGHVIFSIDDVVMCGVNQRINRFVVEALGPDGKQLLVHNTNTGRLEDILFMGSRVYCVPRRRLGKTTYFILGSTVYGGSLINTRIQEKVFLAAVEDNLISWLSGVRCSKVSAPSR